MKRELKPNNDVYQLHLEYVIRTHIHDFWKLLTTTDGLQRWFPELERFGDSLCFTSGDFQQSLAISHEEKEKELTLDWFGANVSFTLRQDGTKVFVTFDETIPNDFPNMVRDLAGWTNQVYRLKIYAETGFMPDKMAMFNEAQYWVEKEIRKNTPLV